MFFYFLLYIFVEGKKSIAIWNNDCEFLYTFTDYSIALCLKRMYCGLFWPRKVRLPMIFCFILANVHLTNIAIYRKKNPHNKKQTTSIFTNGKLPGKF